jgi:hypothetical protein
VCLARRRVSTQAGPPSEAGSVSRCAFGASRARGQGERFSAGFGALRVYAVLRRPRGEQQQQPRVLQGSHRVALAWVEDRNRAGPCQPSAVGRARRGRAQPRARRARAPRARRAHRPPVARVRPRVLRGGSRARRDSTAPLPCSTAPTFSSRPPPALCSARLHSAASISPARLRTKPARLVERFRPSFLTEVNVRSGAPRRAGRSDRGRLAGTPAQARRSPASGGACVRAVLRCSNAGKARCTVVRSAAEIPQHAENGLRGAGGETL